jgi:hypothetical protein
MNSITRRRFLNDLLCVGGMLGLVAGLGSEARGRVDEPTPTKKPKKPSPKPTPTRTPAPPHVPLGGAPVPMRPSPGDSTQRWLPQATPTPH